MVKDDILGIINLAHDYYMVKFNTFSDYEFAFDGGLWLIYDYYLIVRPWSTHFDSKKDKIEKIAMWIHLSGLPL